MSPLAKHVLSDPKELVKRSLQGLVYANPKLELDLESRVVYLKSPPKDQVALISGGGSGHEPAHAGFVGDGMLTAAVCGDIFASPNAKQVNEAINLVDSGIGVLLVVKNYTGDVLNFGLARERHVATKKSPVRIVVVGDDVAVGKTQGKLVGRRGLAGTVLVYKIAGALAAQGESFDEVTAFAKWTAQNIATVGVGYEHCHVPAGDPRTSSDEGKESKSSKKEEKKEDVKGGLGSDELEIGMGIHNEPGFSTLQVSSTPLPKLVEELLSTLLSPDDKERAFLESVKLDGKDEVVLLVNNLGGLSELELSAVAREVGEQAVNSKWKLQVKGLIVGTLMTSLNMPGFSITILALPRSEDKVRVRPDPSAEEVEIESSRVLELLFEEPPEGIRAWGVHKYNEPGPLKAGEDNRVDASKGKAAFKEGAEESAPGPKPQNEKEVLAAIKQACRQVIAAEKQITDLDLVAGDGDCGATLRAGAEAVLKLLEDPQFPSGDVAAVCKSVAEATEVAMGGTSGGLYSIFLNALSKNLNSANDGKEKTVTADSKVWSQALEAALNTLFTYTRARPPSRTLVDPLSSFVLTFASKPDDFQGAVAAAEDAAEATKYQIASAGRAAYVDREKVSKAEVQDAGSFGLVLILQGIAKIVHRQSQ